MSLPEREITLKDQWKLALAIASDPALSRGDVAIALHIVDRFFKRKGNARASHNLLADKAGISRRNTVHSLKRLLAGGYFEVQAKGRRAGLPSTCPTSSWCKFNRIWVSRTTPQPRIQRVSQTTTQMLNTVSQTTP